MSESDCLPHRHLYSTAHDFPGLLEAVDATRSRGGDQSPDQIDQLRARPFFPLLLASPTNTRPQHQNWVAKLEEDNRLIVHAAANAQRAVDLILGSAFEEVSETTENAGDAAVSGIPSAFAMKIAPAIYGHAHF